MLRPRYMTARALGAPITTTTDDVNVAINVLQTNLDSLDRDVIAWYDSVTHTPEVDRFAASWDDFRKRVRAFIYEWQTQGFNYIKAKLTPGAKDPGPVIKLSWNYYDNAQGYNKQYQALYQKFAQISGQQPTMPNFDIPEHNPDPYFDPFKSGQDFGRWITYGLVGLGVLAIIIAFKKSSSSTVVVQSAPAPTKATTP